MHPLTAPEFDALDGMIATLVNEASARLHADIAALKSMSWVSEV